MKVQTLIAIVLILAALSALDAQPTGSQYDLTFENPDCMKRIQPLSAKVARHAFPGEKGHCLEWTVEGESRQWSLIRIYSVPGDLRNFRAFQFKVYSGHPSREPLLVRIVDGTYKSIIYTNLNPPMNHWAVYTVPLHFMKPSGKFDPSKAACIEFGVLSTSEPGRIGIDDLVWKRGAGPKEKSAANAVLDPAAGDCLDRVWAVPDGGVRRVETPEGNVLEWNPRYYTDQWGRDTSPRLRVRGFPADLRPYRAVRLLMGVEPAVEQNTLWIELMVDGKGQRPALRAIMPALGTELTSMELPFHEFYGDRDHDPRRFCELRLRLARAWKISRDTGIEFPQVRVRIRRLELVEGKREGSDWTPALQAKIDALGRVGPAALSDLDALLTRHDGDEGVEVRCSVVRALAGIGSPAAKLLLEVLDFDTEYRVALAAAGALREMGVSLVPLIPDLMDTVCACAVEQGSRSWAAAELLVVAGPSGVDAVIRLLGHSVDEVRSSVRGVLFKMDAIPEKAVRTWRTLLVETEDIDVAQDAADDLARLEKRGIEMLVPLLDHPKEITRRAALFALMKADALPDAEKRLAVLDSEDRLEIAKEALLGEPSSKTALRALLRCTEDPDPEVRAAAFNSICMYPDRVKRVVPKLLKLLSNADGETRRCAAVTLSQAGRSDAVVQALLAALVDPEFSVAEAAAESLRKLVPRADTELPAMAAFLMSSRMQPRIEEMRKQLIETLRKTTTVDDPAGVLQAEVDKFLERLGREAVADLRMLLKEDNPEIQKAAIDALARLHVREAIPDIRPFLDHKKPALRIAAANMLYDFGGDDPYPRLVGLFEDPSDKVRYAAVMLMKKLRMKEAAADLVKLLRDEEDSLRCTAVMALAVCGSKEDASEVARLIEEEEPLMKLVVLHAIGNLDPGGHRETLRKHLDTIGRKRGAELRRMAAVGLARIQDSAAREVLMVHGPLVMLNYYLAPDTMKRLEEVELTRAEVRSASNGEVFDRQQKKTGIRFKVTKQAQAWWLDVKGLDNPPLRFSLLEFLNSLNPRNRQLGETYWPVVGKGEVRILTEKEARSIWLEQIRKWKEEAEGKSDKQAQPGKKAGRSDD